MTPQVLNLDSEVLEEFREKFDKCIEALIRNLIDKGLSAGEVGGKLKIEIHQTADDSGEVFWLPVIKPDVTMKISAKGKIECTTQEGMILKQTPCGMPLVATNQITIDDLVEADRKGA